MTTTSDITHVLPDAHWYVIHSKPRQESRALENLQRQGFETFMPVYQTQKKHRDRLRMVEEPLFKRYLFVRFDPDHSPWHVIRNTFGVSELVRLGGQLAQVPDTLIQTLMQADEPAQTLYRQGERLRVTAGPFRDLECVFEMQDGDSRAIILIEFLNKTQKISISVNALSHDG